MRKPTPPPTIRVRSTAPATGKPSTALILQADRWPASGDEIERTADRLRHRQASGCRRCNRASPARKNTSTSRVASTAEPRHTQQRVGHVRRSHEAAKRCDARVPRVELPEAGATRPVITASGANSAAGHHAQAVGVTNRRGVEPVALQLDADRDGRERRDGDISLPRRHVSRVVELVAKAASQDPLIVAVPLGRVTVVAGDGRDARELEFRAGREAGLPAEHAGIDLIPRALVGVVERGGEKRPQARRHAFEAAAEDGG